MDRRARFCVLFREAYPALHRYARHRGLSAEDAEDLAADTLEIAWRRLEDVPVAEPLPWLYGVARNVLRNRHRRERHREAVVVQLSRSRAPASEDDPVAAAVAGAWTLRAALGELSEDDQELLELVAWDGLTPAQVAVAIGCSEGAARTRLHRARNRLAAQIGADQAPDRPLRRGRRPGQVRMGTNSQVTTTEVCDG